MTATTVLFGWCRMPDVADARIYLAGAAAILEEYPQEVRDVIADPRTGTRLLKAFPSLHDLREACDKAYEPLERAIERQRASESHRKALPPPRDDTPQARKDALVEDWYKRSGPPRGRRGWDAPPSADQKYHAPMPAVRDGKHGSRVMAEIELRRARKETGPPPSSS